MTNMRLAIISLPVVVRSKGIYHKVLMDAQLNNPQLAVYLLAGIIAQEYEIDVIDMALRESFSDDDIVSAITNYDILLISFNSVTWPLGNRIAILAKQLDRAKILIAGGPHPTLYPNSTAIHAPFDFIVRGEAETVILPLLRDLITRRTNSLSQFESRNAASAPILRNCLDDNHTIPSPQWSNHQQALDYMSLPLETSRGCESSCAFCSIPGKRSWRPMPNGVIREGLLSIKVSGFSLISLSDDCFTTDDAHIEQQAGVISEVHPNSKFIVNSRVLDILRPGYALSTMDSNIQSILVGGECGYDEGLRRVRKRITIADLRESAAKLQRMGFANRSVYSFIIGFPWEDLSMVKKTISFAFEVIMEYDVCVFLQWYVPIPGSSIFNLLDIPVETFMQFNALFSQDLVPISSNLSGQDILRVDETVASLKHLLRLNKQDKNLQYLPIADYHRIANKQIQRTQKAARLISPIS